MIYLKICALRERGIDAMPSKFDGTPLLSIKYTDILKRLSQPISDDIELVRTQAMSSLKGLFEPEFIEDDSSVVVGLDRAKEMLKLRVKNTQNVINILIVYNNSDNTLSIYLRKDEDVQIQLLIKTALKPLLS